MSLKLTEQEIKRVKNTTRVFIIIFLVCAVIAGVFCALIPRTKQIKTLGANEELIESFVDSHDGETYFLHTKNILCEYDSYTGEKLSEMNLTNAIKSKVGAQNVVKGSFQTWRISAVSGLSGDYFIVNDSNGNYFKLERNSDGKLEVCDDWFLITANPDGSFYPKDIKGLDFMEGTDDLYALILENNEFFIEKYDIGNLSAGASKKKFLWDVQLEEDGGFKKIQAMKAATGVLAFYAHDGYLYFIKQQGGVLRVSEDLIDGVDEFGNERNFFEDAKALSEIPEDLLDLYNATYEQAYNDSIAGALADWCLTYVVMNDGAIFEIKDGEGWKAITASDITAICGEEITKEMLADKAKRAEVAEELKALFASSVDGENLVYNKEDLQARHIRDNGKEVLFPNSANVNTATTAAKEAAKEILPPSDWFKNYSAIENSMFIDKSYLDEKYYVSFRPGESIIYGMILSKQNNALYYTNASDGYVYVVDLAVMAEAKQDDLVNVASMAKRIDTIHCGKGQTFSNFGNGLGYNKFANSLFLKYANERKLTIVDINVKDIKNVAEYKVLSTFTGSFDMFSLSGTKDNSIVHVIHQVTKVDKKGVDHNYLYVCSYEPERFENKPLITAIFVIFLVLAIVTLFISLWLLVCSKSEAGIKKVVFIAKDTKKNKFVYLALVPFVTMLILFCYYEAFGAIAMSFFDYTRDKPAWIWNNFGNYVKIFNNKNFLPSVLNMLFFLASDIILCIIPPIIFAILLILIRNKTASSWIRSLMFIPGIIPSIAGMLIWRVGIYGDEGVLNQIVMACGGQPVNWLLNRDYARWSLIMMGFPFVGGYLIFYGGMMNIPTEYHEAGKLEGLGTIKRFLKIDIPLIMPQIKYIFITTFIASVQNFARTHILKSTVVLTPVQTMYTMMTEQADYGMSSAYATLIFIFLFAAIATNFKMQKQEAMGADL